MMSVNITSSVAATNLHCTVVVAETRSDRRGNDRIVYAVPCSVTLVPLL